jgi:hypothetical protein
VSRINAGQEQNILDQFGVLDERYRIERTGVGEDLKKSLRGLNFTFDLNPDGTLKIGQTDRLGIRQQQGVQGARNQGAARGQLYSSFTDQAVGNSLQNLNLFATEAIGQYGKQIKQSNTNYLIETQNLNTRLQELLTDDVKWAAANPPPAPVNQSGNTINAGLAPNLGLEPWGHFPLDAEGHPIVWAGKNPPNANTIQRQFPNMTWTSRQRGDGSWVVVLGGYAPAAWSAINQARGLRI